MYEVRAWVQFDINSVQDPNPVRWNRDSIPTFEDAVKALDNLNKTNTVYEAHIYPQIKEVGYAEEAKGQADSVENVPS